MWWPVDIAGTRRFVFFDKDDGGGGGGESSGGEEGEGEGDKGEDDDKTPEFLKLPGDGKGLASPKLKKRETKITEGPTDERPSNVPEKFWDVENKAVRVDALMESYTEAESALSRSRAEKKVPEFPEGYLDVFTFDSEGNMKYSEGVDRLPAIAKDDPVLQNALKSFHKHGIAAEQAAGIIKDFFLDANGVYPEAFDNEAFTAQQQLILGKNHEVQTETAQAWIVSLHTQGVLNENEARSLHNHVGEDAHGIMALNKLRAMVTGEVAIPIHDPIPEDGIPTPEELYTMKMQPEYATDAKYRKKVDDLFPVVFPGKGNARFEGLGQASIEANALRARQAKNKQG